MLSCKILRIVNNNQKEELTSMEENYSKIISVALVAILSLLVFYLIKYLSNVNKKCPKCKSLNIERDEPVFIQEKNKYVYSTHRERSLFERNSSAGEIRMNRGKPIKIKCKVYSVKCTCLSCGYVYEQELIE